MSQPWPVTLPDYFLRGSYNESPKKQFRRSNTELGRPKTRRLFTANIKSASGTMRMTKAQIDILDSFYDLDCVGGTDTFILNNPFGGTQEFSWVEPPSWVHVGYDKFDVRFTLEILP